MYQKCPICNGTGKSYNNMTINTSSTCRTCNGKGIISKLTGNAPTWQGDMNMESQQEYFGLNKKPYSSGDFRDDDNRESQDEYFGRK